MIRGIRWLSDEKGMASHGDTPFGIVEVTSATLENEWNMWFNGEFIERIHASNREEAKNTADTIMCDLAKAFLNISSQQADIVATNNP